MDTTALVIAALCTALLLVFFTVGATRRHDHRQRLTSNGRHVVLVRLAGDDWMLVCGVHGRGRHVLHFDSAVNAHRAYLEALADVDPTTAPLGTCWEHLWGTDPHVPATVNLVVNPGAVPSTAQVRMEQRIGLAVTRPGGFRIPPGAGA